MKNILIITASIFGQDGQSSRLVSQTLDQLRQTYGDIQATYRVSPQSRYRIWTPNGSVPS